MGWFRGGLHVGGRVHKRLDVDDLDVDLIDFVGWDWEEGDGLDDIDVDDFVGVWGRLKDIDDGWQVLLNSKSDARLVARRIT